VELEVVDPWQARSGRCWEAAQGRRRSLMHQFISTKQSFVNADMIRTCKIKYPKEII
jgi:hypothetical protein